MLETAFTSPLSFRGGSLPVDLFLLSARGLVLSPVPLFDTTPALQLTRFGRSLALVRDPLARVRDPLALVGARLTFGQASAALLASRGGVLPLPGKPLPLLGKPLPLLGDALALTSHARQLVSRVGRLWSLAGRRLDVPASITVGLHRDHERACAR